MRLNKQKIHTIRQFAKECFGNDSEVYLFGSRVHDNLEENSKMVNSLYHEVETLYKLFVNIKQYVQKKIFPYIPNKEMTRFDFDTPELH